MIGMFFSSSVEIGFLPVHYRTFITVAAEHHVGVGDGLPHGLLGPQPHHLPVPRAGPHQQNGLIIKYIFFILLKVK